jgi:hypothetical protein
VKIFFCPPNQKISGLLDKGFSVFLLLLYNVNTKLTLDETKKKKEALHVGVFCILTWVFLYFHTGIFYNCQSLWGTF